MSKATLLVIHGADQGNRFEIGDQPVGIGRGVRNEIRIIDNEVSRQHATIHRANGAFIITDKNSSNGTSVNGENIRVRELKNGDRVQLGRSVLLFSEKVEDESKYIAGRVDLVARQSADDRSSIVGEVSHDFGRTLVDRNVPVDAPAVSQTLANLQALYRISDEAVSPSISLDQLLKRILDLTIDVVGADRGCVLLDNPATGEVVPQVLSYSRRTDHSARMPVSRSIVDYVLQKGQGVRTSDARTDQRFEPGQSILQAGICEAMCVPMQGRYANVGVIYVDTTTPPERVILRGGAANQFSEDHLKLLVAIGRQAALAVENNRYQQALVNAERLAAMGQTIAVLSHHIKNILQGVRGGSYLIDMGLKDHNEEIVRKGWAIVEKNQGKIYHLVMDMLTFSKERQPVMREAQLNDTVGDICELMQARADDCSVALECRLAKAMPIGSYDEEGIHRAVLNVVINAIDAIEGTEGGRVVVETGHDAERDLVFVAVTDNGPGIPPDQLGRIFNIFESTKGGRGTGLGLAVSQKILREHGGEIHVESKPGFGSRFVLTWPRYDEEHRSADSSSAGN